MFKVSVNGDEDGGRRFEETELDGHLVCVATNFKKSHEYQVIFFIISYFL